MKKIFLSIISIIALISLTYQKGNSQCSATTSNGINLVTNGDFSQAYTGWTFQSPDYTQFTPCGSSCYSVPGRIYAGNKSTDFNQAFNMGSGVNIPDHTNTADNIMLMVDGVCTSGIKLWSQGNIPVTANTNYYFSVWITSLSNTTPRGTLQFDINGTNFPTTITSVGAVGAWTKYTYVWNSGLTPPATATISIENTTITGCNSAVDFAIDDISFTPGCDFGTPGPTPDLGANFTICGKTIPFNINPNFVAATAAANNITYNWYKNGVLQVANSGVGPAFYNYSVTGPGTYSVCADSAGSCPKTGVVVIASNFTIDLGPDQILCNPTTATIDALYTGPGVTYQWSLNGSGISGANGRTLSVSNPGNYSVSVTDPICGTQTDNITITTNAATPVDGTFCPTASGGTGIASLSVTGSGKYKWWTASTGGSVLAKGNTYTTPALTAPGPYVYYVEDTSVFSLTVGPTIVKNGSGYGIGAKENQYAPNAMTQNVNANGTDTTNASDHRYSLLIFNASTDFVIDTISVLMINYYCSGAAQDKIILRIRDKNGKNLPGSPLVYQQPCQLQNNGPNFPAPIVKIPVKIAIPQGTGYQIETVSNGGGGAIFIFKNETNGGSLPSPVRYAYPTTYTDLSGNPVVQFVSNSPAEWTLYNNPTTYPGFFDWKITKGINCQRVPVTARLSCPPPTGCTTPAALTSVSSDTSFCVSTTTQIKLTANGGGGAAGDTLVWYSGACGGTLVGKNITGAPILITAPTVATRYYARWQNSGCNSACLSFMATPVQAPSHSVAGTAQPNLCNITTATLAANTPSVGSGIWSVVSGAGIVSNPGSPNSPVTGLAASGTLVLKWKISNGICPADSSTVSLTTNSATPPTTLSVSPDSVYCTGATTQISLSATGGNGTSLVWYQGSCGGTPMAVTTNIAAPAAATTYFARWETGTCYSVCKSITVHPKTPSVASSGPNQNLCNTTTTNLNATAPATGSGIWSVVSGPGNISDPTNPMSVVTGLIPSSNLVLKWKITNSPCLADSSNITIHVDTLTAPVFSSTGPSFDTCANTSGIVYNTRFNHPANTYTWSTSGTLSITAQSNNSVTISTGNSGGSLMLTEVNGACSLNTSNLITIAQPVSAAYAGADRNICVNKIALNGTQPAVGIGKWTVTSGSGVFADMFDPKSVISSLGNGVNTFTWTVSGCGGPLTDDVNIMVGTSGMNIQIAGPGDTMCTGTARALNATLIGGSGKYNYTWLSSDSSFKTITNAPSTVVTPLTTSIKYYVYAVDLQNLGCSSNLDSVTVSSVTHQELVIPNLITPNGDSHNDDLLVKGVDNSKLLPNAYIEVVNGWGQVVYKNSSYDNQWKADQTADGVYYYYLKTGCGQKVYKGWLQISR